MAGPTYHHHVGDQALGLSISLFRIWPVGISHPLGGKNSPPGAAKKPTQSRPGNWERQLPGLLLPDLPRPAPSYMSQGPVLKGHGNNKPQPWKPCKGSNPVRLLWGFEWGQQVEWDFFLNMSFSVLFTTQKVFLKRGKGKAFIINQRKFLSNHKEEFCWRKQLKT